MRTNARAVPGLLALALGLSLLMGAGPAGAQGNGDDGAGIPLGFIKADRGIIRTQIELSLNYAQQSLAMLEAGADGEDLRTANTLAHDSYRLMRFAIEGLDLLIHHSRHSKVYKDPILLMTRGIVNKARFLNIDARLYMDNAAPGGPNRERYMVDAIQRLQESIPLTEQALTLL
jgi:hypothetical protein